MARTTGSDGERTEAATREAALSLIARHGYDAVSMRQLAAEVGVQAASACRWPSWSYLPYSIVKKTPGGVPLHLPD